jgi:hypothetical protein
VDDVARRVYETLEVGLVRQGLPIGGQMLAEFGAFAAMSLIAGRGGTTNAAAHAIINCLTDVSYVLPLVGDNTPCSSRQEGRGAGIFH